jgi:hypothetical protein
VTGVYSTIISSVIVSSIEQARAMAPHSGGVPAAPDPDRKMSKVTVR